MITMMAFWTQKKLIQQATSATAKPEPQARQAKTALLVRTAKKAHRDYRAHKVMLVHKAL